MQPGNQGKQQQATWGRSGDEAATGRWPAGGRNEVGRGGELAGVLTDLVMRERRGETRRRRWWAAVTVTVTERAA